jgi:hypothetical protein
MNVIIYRAPKSSIATSCELSSTAVNFLVGRILFLSLCYYTSNEIVYYIWKKTETGRRNRKQTGELGEETNKMKGQGGGRAAHRASRRRRSWRRRAAAGGGTGPGRWSLRCPCADATIRRRPPRRCHRHRRVVGSGSPWSVSAPAARGRLAS